MKNNIIKLTLSIILIILLISVLLSCSAKYSRNLFMTYNEDQSKVKIEEAKYIPGSVIANPFKEVKIKSGDGSMIILVTGSRGNTMKDMTDIIIGFDKYIKHTMYFQLPALPETGTYKLKDQSLIQLMGHYELPEASKIFLPVSGFISVDSINGNKMFGTVKGKYENNDKISFDLSGNFTVKM